MSYELTAWAIAVERPVEAGADWTTVKLTLAAMASFADSRGRECFASVATIADRVGVSHATIKRAIRSLTQLGLIVAAAEQSPGRPTRFKFSCDVEIEHGPKSVVAENRSDPGHARPGSPSTYPLGHGRPKGWATHDPQTRSSSRDLTRGASGSTGRPHLALVPESSSTTCERHPHGTDLPCRECGAVRRRNEEAEERLRLAALQEAREERERHLAVQQEMICRCAMCDDRGYRGGRVCNHDPDHDARNARGIAQIRAVLARNGAS